MKPPLTPYNGTSESAKVCFAIAREHLRRGARLSDAAKQVGVSPTSLDLGLWKRVIRHGERLA